MRGLVLRPASALGLLPALGLLFLLALQPSAELQAQDADLITGQVTRANGDRLPGVRIEVISIELETTRSAVTGTDGRYTILFPDGGGAYLLRATYIGKDDAVFTVARQGEEELLVQDIVMQSRAIRLEGIEVEGRLAPPSGATGGEQTTELSQDLLNRLPLPDLDPTTVALLSAGVVATDLDSISGRAGFSVGGMSELLNEVTLDGISLGDSELQLPEEGIRRTGITTSTFDASRGGFAGGLVNLTSARGTNRTGGALTWRFDDDALQMNSPATSLGFTRQSLGGSWGGPIIRDQLFYNVSFQGQRNRTHRFALTADDPLAAQRSGVAPDSVARFLDILEAGRALPVGGLTGPYDQVSDDLRFSGRLDWTVSQRSTSSHNLSARVNLNRAGQDSTRISPLDLSEQGGDTERATSMASVTLNSRFLTSWTHRLTASVNRTENESVPFSEIPQGRVRVTSQWEDGTRDARTLTFGGNRGMPAESRSTSLQLSNELSFLRPVGSQIHRFKVGGSLDRQESTSRSTNNLFGSFSYASLADFEENRPDRFERALTERESTTARRDLGFFVTDTWRVSQPLELTLGLRWDHSALEDRPEYNPAVEEAFGRSTDIRPAASLVSPRLGFSYQLGRSGTGLPIPGMGRSLSGGIGVFAGRAPVQVFQQAYRQTGLPSAEQNLICIGEAVPIPDWGALGSDPTLVPTTCSDGGMGVPPSFSSRAPTITLLEENSRLPASLRADLGFRTLVADLLPVNIRYTYTRGFGLWGARDLNLDESDPFLLDGEGRPFFGDPAAISARTGAVAPATSRLDPEFGNVFEITTDLRSSAHQFSLQGFGGLGDRTTLMANYTLGFARDEGSAGGGTGRFGGGSGGLLAPTAGSPNEREWAPSTNDRRHTLNLTLSHALRPSVEVSLMGRLMSGAPFTPLVDRDINGDGLRNDRAFVFDPAAAADPAVVAGMESLLATAPSRVVDCLDSQLGGVATRNSCRNGWTQSLSARLNIRPELPGLDRRLTVSVDAQNVLAGMDQLFNGSGNMRGWGEGARAEPVLLRVRGFDADRGGFDYEVNEGFGQNRRGANALRQPFSLRISARLTLGNTRGGNQGFGGAASAMGALRGMGGGGGFGGVRGGAGGAGNILGALLRGEVPEAEDLVLTLLPNPIHDMIPVADSLGMTERQSTALHGIAFRLDEALEPRREAITPVVTELLEAVAPAPGGTGRGQGGMGGFQALQGTMGRLQPELDGARAEVEDALREAEEALGEELWEQLPAPLRSGIAAPGGGRAGAGGAAGMAGGGGFNALGTLDRMLANPIPVVLEFRDRVGMSDEQIQQIEVISGELDRELIRRREQLGRRFDGVEGPRALQLFREVQPEIRAGREDMDAAMERVRRVLTPEQWRQLPEALRQPMADAEGTPGGGRGPGGRSN
ncbi:MAG: hypothetical protein EA352_04530 [Gemmatimonadales bacterium]|nr:MAG: hypothetical protein EA352_04530 [Gemmatimonadales bacterium]